MRSRHAPDGAGPERAYWPNSMRGNALESNGSEPPWKRPTQTAPLQDRPAVREMTYMVRTTTHEQCSQYHQVSYPRNAGNMKWRLQEKNQCPFRLRIFLPPQPP